jgi:hypothetical protein
LDLVDQVERSLLTLLEDPTDVFAKDSKNGELDAA